MLGLRHTAPCWSHQEPAGTEAVTNTTRSPQTHTQGDDDDDNNTFYAIITKLERLQDQRVI